MFQFLIFNILKHSIHIINIIYSTTVCQFFTSCMIILLYSPLNWYIPLDIGLEIILIINIIMIIVLHSTTERRNLSSNAQLCMDGEMRFQKVGSNFIYMHQKIYKIFADNSLKRWYSSAMFLSFDFIDLFCRAFYTFDIRL